MKTIAALVVFFGTWTGAVASDKKVAPLEFALETEEGKAHKLASAKGSVTVLEWARPDCPCTLDYYKGELLSALQEEMRGRSVKWFVVLPVKKGEPASKRKEMRRLLEKAGAKPDLFLFDPGFKFTDALGIEVLPHVLILDEAGRPAYRGLLDTECKTVAEKELLKTRKASLPQSEQRNYLRDSLNDLLSGNPIAERETKAKGCLIRRFKVVAPEGD